MRLNPSFTLTFAREFCRSYLLSDIRLEADWADKDTDWHITLATRFISASQHLQKIILCRSYFRMSGPSESEYQVPGIPQVTDAANSPFLIMYGSHGVMDAYFYMTDSSFQKKTVLFHLRIGNNTLENYLRTPFPWAIPGAERINIFHDCCILNPINTLVRNRVFR